MGKAKFIVIPIESILSFFIHVEICLFNSDVNYYYPELVCF